MSCVLFLVFHVLIFWCQDLRSGNTSRVEIPCNEWNALLTSFNLCLERQFSSVNTLIFCWISISSESLLEVLRGLRVARTLLSPASGLLFNSINCSCGNSRREEGSMVQATEKRETEEQNSSVRKAANEQMSYTSCLLFFFFCFLFNKWKNVMTTTTSHKKKMKMMFIREGISH